MYIAISFLYIINITVSYPSFKLIILLTHREKGYRNRTHCSGQYQAHTKGPKMIEVVHCSNKDICLYLFYTSFKYYL